MANKIIYVLLIVGFIGTLIFGLNKSYEMGKDDGEIMGYVLGYTQYQLDEYVVPSAYIKDKTLKRKNPELKQKISG